MAKQKIENKEQAILEAAIHIFAERGFWNTPTSLISKTAGVADGTLFNYFKSKDDLIHGIYLELKLELAASMLEGFKEHQTVRDKLKHIWTYYIDWGLQNPKKYKVLNQIGTSYELSKEVKAQGNEAFMEIGQLADELITSGIIHDYPVEYLTMVMDAQANMTIQYINQHPDDGIDYKSIGFNILWDGVSR